MTLLHEGSRDDAFIQLPDIGFDFPFYDGSYRTNIYICSNSYITFGYSSSNYSGLSATNPGRAIHIGSGDRSYQRVYGYPSQDSYSIHFEGSTGTSGEVGNPTHTWECTLYNSGDIGIFTTTIATGNNLVTDGTGNAYTEFALNANESTLIERVNSNTYQVAGGSSPDPTQPPTQPPPSTPSGNLNHRITSIQFHLKMIGRDQELNLNEAHSDTVLSQIDNALLRCQDAFADTSLYAGSLEVEEEEITNQNIDVVTQYPTRYGTSTTTTTYGNKTKITSKRPSYQHRLSAYYREVERLALILRIRI